MGRGIQWEPGEHELALVLPNERYPDLPDLKEGRRLLLGPKQRAVVFIKNLPRPMVFSEGEHKLPKKVQKLVVVSTGRRNSPFGVPKRTVFEQLGFSGMLILRIEDRDDDVERFVEKLVLEQRITTLGELVQWLVRNYLIRAFKDVVAAEGMSEEEFVRAGEKLAEKVRDVANSYIMEYGLYLENISVQWWAR
ncbi:hypothetical protein B6U66_04025 [Candidatus Bathyarchaeota archaeon ex4484_135]|nr:MAG: hypothetical protein B6U66_04025 [Candidatus Bathyarchaeota archaeon ex4484_135]